jgi:hypothetical protein
LYKEANFLKHFTGSASHANAPTEKKNSVIMVGQNLYLTSKNPPDLMLYYIVCGPVAITETDHVSTSLQDYK